MDLDPALADIDMDSNDEQKQSDDGNEELSGWADSMSKILKSTKPKNKKTLILSRARKDYEINRNPVPTKRDDIEIAADKKPSVDQSKVKEDSKSSVADENVLSLKQQRKLELKQRKLERAWENLNRLTNEEPDREMEIDLLKIATKGVVQLFNAVAQQQKTMKSKIRSSSKSEFKKDKVWSQSKEIFDNALNKNKSVGSESGMEEVEIKEEDISSDEDETNQRKSEVRKTKRKAKETVNTESSSKKPVWQALQDDFMLDAKLKDWDKESDSD